MKKLFFIFAGIACYQELLGSMNNISEHSCSSSLVAEASNLNTSVSEKPQSDLLLSQLHQLPVRECIDGHIVYKKSCMGKIKKFLLTDTTPTHAFDHGSKISIAVFSPDGLKVCTGASNSTAKLWDCLSGRIIHILQHANGVTAVTFSPNGLSILTGTEQGMVQEWNVAAGFRNQHWQFQDSIKSITISPDGLSALIYVSGIPHNQCTLVDIVSNTFVHTFDNVSLDPMFSPNGLRILTVSENTMTFWQVHTGEPELMMVHPATDEDLKIEQNKYITAAAISQNGLYIATGLNTGTIRIWNTLTQFLMRKFTYQKHCILYLAFSTDGSTCISASRCRLGQMVCLWDTQKGTLISCYDNRYGVYPVVFFPNTNRYLVCPIGLERVMLINKKGQKIYTFEHEEVSDMSVSQDETKILTIDKTSGRVRMWDLASLLPSISLFDKCNIDQIELLIGLNMTFKELGRIQASNEQWHAFKTLPLAVQKKLEKRIKASEKIVLSQL